jgi:hypothetical protein
MDPMAASLGLVFTDSRGRVVFGDSHFLDLIGPDRAVAMVGQSLHTLLSADAEVIQSLIAEIGGKGYVRDQRLGIVSGTGAQMVVACSGIASYDDQGGFIGVDLTLRDPDHTALPSTMLDTHGDVLNARILQIQYESADLDGEKIIALSNLYFSSQLSAIEILAGRIAGPRVLEALENMLNQSASKRGWPVQIKGGRLVAQLDKTPLEAYRVLLSEVFSYISNIIGQRAVIEEMKLVDAHVNTESREVAGQSGLRDLFR